MKEDTRRSPLLRETVLLSAFSVILQGMGLLLNIFLTRRLGAASVGALTLISSFYGLACVLSGGSGFIGTSRFLSEELGKDGNPRRVFRYSLALCLCLSGSAAALLSIFAPQAAGYLSKTGATAWNVRLLGLSLPIAAALSCMKGRCYAYRRAILPAVSECIEFLIRAGVLAFFTIFLIPSGRASVLTAFAAAMTAGQGSALLFLSMIPMPRLEKPGESSIRFRHFFGAMLPVIGNASLVAVLSSTNDALVPLTLRQFGNSTEDALAQFGEFEAIIIPTLFFPSVVQCCMSGLLVPELSRSRAENDLDSVRRLTERVLAQTISFSLPVVVCLVQFGRQLGSFLGGNAFTGEILRYMAPVVPFIYLEIILEGVLRGLGKQNFSSVNYLAEYIVRISVLLICVPLFGFYGIAASYMACNLSGNAVRLYFVLRVTKLRPDWKRVLLYPAFAALLSWEIGRLIMLTGRMLHLRETVLAALFVVVCAGIYCFCLRVLKRFSDSEGLSSRETAALGKH